MPDLFDKLDRHGVLKVPLSLWAIIVFQARYWLLLAAVAASARRSPEAARLLGDGVPYLQLALELPVLLLVVAVLNRQPAAGALVRQVWHHGRQLITLTACLNLAWIGWYLNHVQYWHPWPDNLVLLSGMADLAIIAAAWASQSFRELFAEFPASPRSLRERISS